MVSQWWAHNWIGEQLAKQDIFRLQVSVFQTGSLYYDFVFETSKVSRQEEILCLSFSPSKHSHPMNRIELVVGSGLHLWPESQYARRTIIIIIKLHNVAKCSLLHKNCSKK